MVSRMGKNFDNIIDEYSFFETHSNQAEATVEAYSRHLSKIDMETSADSTIRMLDFGTGTGNFTQQFLKKAGWPKDKLNLSLVEPGEFILRQAVNKLQAFTSAPIKHWPTLPNNQNFSFDLILANHVFYYTPRLQLTIEDMLKRLTTVGKIFIAIAGRETPLIQLGYRGYGLIGQNFPYNTADDVLAIIKRLNIPLQKEPVSYQLIFPDSEENRLHMIRFLFFSHLKQMAIEQLLTFFDPYVLRGKIHVDVEDEIFVLG